MDQQIPTATALARANAALASIDLGHLEGLDAETKRELATQVRDLHREADALCRRLVAEAIQAIARR